ncbi:hypothetical protein [Mycolicibacter heraklionensis]|uniref:hypothetical protein n=1 Tax=Mycolicibacter heraklionensis TaxID=512402 RepID=UPI001038E0F7|nr:hypothetical protein [Mycolicibacter heraklionensis]
MAGEWSVDRTADGTGGGTGDDIIGNGAQQAWAAGAGHEDRAQDARADPGVCERRRRGGRDRHGGDRHSSHSQKMCDAAFAVHGIPSW